MKRLLLLASLWLCGTVQAQNPPHNPFTHYLAQGDRYITFVEWSHEVQDKILALESVVLKQQNCIDSLEAKLARAHIVAVLDSLPDSTGGYVIMSKPQYKYAEWRDMLWLYCIDYKLSFKADTVKAREK